MKPFCFADGEIIPSQDARLHPADLAVIRGYGIFDFFRTQAYSFSAKLVHRALTAHLS